MPAISRRPLDTAQLCWCCGSPRSELRAVILGSIPKVLFLWKVDDGSPLHAVFFLCAHFAEIVQGLGGTTTGEGADDAKNAMELRSSSKSQP